MVRGDQTHRVLPLQGHLPLSVSHLLDLQGYLHGGRWGARWLLLRMKGLAGSLSSSTSTRRLLGGRRRAIDRFTLGLVEGGGSWWSAGVRGKTAGVLLELLVLRRVHQTTDSTSACHRLELWMQRVLGGQRSLVLLLDSKTRAWTRTQSLLRRQGLGGGLWC